MSQIRPAGQRLRNDDLDLGDILGNKNLHLDDTCNNNHPTSGAMAERWKITAGTERICSKKRLVRLVENSAATRGLKHTADNNKYNTTLVYIEICLTQ